MNIFRCTLILKCLRKNNIYVCIEKNYTIHPAGGKGRSRGYL